MEDNLFVRQEIILHSGDKSDFKIECDALSNDDWQCLAYLISKMVRFRYVWAIPTGANKLGIFLLKYLEDDENLPTLIVDDVFTTGRSMEEARSQMKGDVIGVVVFSRGKCPNWITPIFQMAI